MVVLPKWTGIEWCVMELHRRGRLNSLGMWNDETFIIGNFAWGPDTTARHVMRWIGGDYTDTCINNTRTNIENFENINFQISLYPNPCQNEIRLEVSNLDLSNIDFEIKIDIVDVVVKLHSQKLHNFLKSGLNIVFDTSHLPPGNYYVTLHKEDLKMSIPFVKL